MAKIPLQIYGSSHLGAALTGFLGTGWVPKAGPATARIVRNGQLISLQTGDQDLQIRLFVYKVTGSGRGRPQERRIEITSTYQKGLSPELGYQDVVLGHDPETNVLVGIDPRRMQHGGPTGNASSFFDREGLTVSSRAAISIRQRPSNIIDTEYTAFFFPERLAEYVFNLTSIHSGHYSGNGHFSGNRRVARPRKLEVNKKNLVGSALVLTHPVSHIRKSSRVEKAVEEFEKHGSINLKKRNISREEMLRLNERLSEIGLSGEDFAVKYERRRLRKAGRNDLAEKIEWVAQEYPFEGYDIISYESTGKKRYIEVKSTTTKSMAFAMTDNEWSVSQKLKSRYFLYRVTNVEKKPNLRILSDPSKLEAEGKLIKNAIVWFVKLL